MSELSRLIAISYADDKTFTADERAEIRQSAVVEGLRWEQVGPILETLEANSGILSTDFGMRFWPAVGSLCGALRAADNPMKARIRYVTEEACNPGTHGPFIRGLGPAGRAAEWNFVATTAASYLAEFRKDLNGVLASGNAHAYDAAVAILMGIDVNACHLAAQPAFNEAQGAFNRSNAQLAGQRSPRR